MSKKNNISIEQNATLSKRYELVNINTDNSETPMDLTGYTVRAAIKKNYDDTKIYATMSLNNILDASGSIQLGMSATETKALPVGS
jgi:hypothetical protein